MKHGFRYYEGGDLFPPPGLPRKPHDPAIHTSGSIAEYAKQLKIYEDALFARQIALEIYWQEKSERLDEFKKDLFEYCKTE
jgi:hypothetical protein